MSKPTFKFSHFYAVVTKFLGIDAFDKKDGKSIITEDQETKLTDAFGAEFVAKFRTALDENKSEEDQNAAAVQAWDAVKEHNATAMQKVVDKYNASQQTVQELMAKNQKLEGEKTVLQETVNALSEEADDTPAQVILGAAANKVEGAPWMGVKLNSKHFHNKMATEYLAGDPAKSMTSGTFTNGNLGATGDTIDTAEVEQEFGTFLSQKAVKLDIFKLLTAKTESQMYMTTKRAITEWRASAAMITSVVQQYVAKWTPNGSTKFTPIVIKNRRHKVNLPITPDDINDSWLSYLYDEGVTPDQMPVTRYIIEMLLRPRIESDIEMEMIATGNYEELGAVNEGDAGQEPSKAMDGYITLITDFLADHANNNVEFFNPETAITDENIVDVIEGFSDFVQEKKPLYAKKGMNLFIDPNQYTRYKRKYRELYPTTKNADKNDDRPDFSNLTFVPLEAMRGTGVFFSTPKENFIRLVHKNAAGSDTRLFLQVENYTVKVFAEFWLGVGFALEELLFAYVPGVESTSGL